MSAQIIIARDYATQTLGYTVVLGAECGCHRMNDTITLNTTELNSISAGSGVTLELTTLYVLLHEMGHTIQPMSHHYLYEFNPIPAEEDAWDRAIGLYYQLFGVDAPIQMYKLRRHCMSTYYSKYGHLIK